ncbi:MAG: hypothetical protein PQJ60_14885 [Spirochaetales bacterium]|nr:hypothetical protein [Spirochaetales bacterium]
MRIVFLTSGKGSGHVVLALSLFNALNRLSRNFEFILMGDYEFAHLCDGLFSQYSIPMEPSLYLNDPRSSQLYLMLKELAPDVLVTDGLWFPLKNMVDSFPFRKIIFFRQTTQAWFKLTAGKYGDLEFDPESFDHCFSIEPGFLPPGFKELNPFVIRNGDEIYSREEARKALGISREKKKICLLAHNGFEGEWEKLKKSQRNIAKEYRLIRSSNRRGKGLFPLADYLNGVDLLIGGAGYNLFYEALYFKKDFHLFPQERKFEDQNWRLKNNSEYSFDMNGADQLAQIIARS